jgi:predicted HTH transcriptional regulator
MPVTDTSRASYHALADDVIKSDKELMYIWILANPGKTRAECAHALGISDGRVAARINDLIHKDKRVKEGPKVINPLSGKMNYSLRIVPVQGELI